MKNIITGTLFLFSTAAFSQNTYSVDSLSWFSGCWKMETKGKTVTECWMKPAGGVMVGVSQTEKGGKTTLIEYMRLQKNPEGILQFTALPSGQKEASFDLKSYSSSEVLFENLKHDYPQRVRYKKISDSAILATIEGTLDGNETVISFSYTKSNW